MKKLDSKIKVGDRQVIIQIAQFDTLREATKELGGPNEVVKLVNYAYSLTQRASARMRLEEK